MLRLSETTGEEVFGMPSGARIEGFSVPIWAALLPGLPRRYARDPRGALVLAGGYASALAAGMLAWGSWLGYGVIAFAVGAHIISGADAIRLRSIPAFSTAVPWAWSSAVFGFGIYVPLLTFALASAWPVEDHRGRQFLVNRWAYQAGAPDTGDWVWPAAGGPGSGPIRVLAGSTKRVEWRSGALMVDGASVAWEPADPTGFPERMALVVPEGMVLVAAPGLAAQDRGMEARLMPIRSLMGRAWARLSPVWVRGPLSPTNEKDRG